MRVCVSETLSLLPAHGVGMQRSRLPQQAGVGFRYQLQEQRCLERLLHPVHCTAVILAAALQAGSITIAICQ